MSEKFTTIASVRRDIAPAPKKPIPTKIVVIAILVLLSIGGFILLINASRKGNKGEEEQIEVEPETRDEEDTSESEEQDEEVEEEETEEGTFDESLFSQDNQQVGVEGVSDVNITNLEHSTQQDFYRVVFTVEAGDEIPFTTGVLKANSNLINIKINGVAQDNSGVSSGTGVDIEDSVVSTIYHEVYSQAGVVSYSIGIKELTSYYLHSLEDPTRIVIDVLEQEVENGASQEFAFSSGAQSIEGDASGNVITISGLSYSSPSGVFRIVFKLGTVGTGNIPNAASEIVDFEGGKAIKLVVSNIYSDFPAGQGYDQQYTNSVVRGIKGSYSSNTSTYYVRLSSVREYKLYYRTAPMQLIVDVKL